MAEFPCLPLWTDALIGDTHQLTPAEFGAYLRLLIVAWRREDCNLPDDDAFLGRSVGDPKNWHRLKQKVLPYFSKGSDGFLRQHRLTDERTYARNLRIRSSAGGRGKALKERHQAAAKKMPNECQKSAPLPLPSPHKIAKAISPSKPLKGDFDGFWNYCPRKIGKGAAAKAYAKALKIADAETLLGGIQRYAASRRGEDAQFTVHPATWLNHQRWLDEGGKANGVAVPVLDAETQAAEIENLKRMGII